MRNRVFKAALFDLDGVVFDTEPQYSIFWGGECRRYHPEQPGLEYAIKGQTLTEILEKYFSDEREEWDAIVGRLNDYERSMDFVYVDGFVDFITSLREEGLKTAVVTSSNVPKMKSVYKHHPELSELFDAILTSEDFDKSKPDPDCYIKGAQRFGVSTEDCLVLEDSFNGLMSARASGGVVIGLATSNPREKIESLSDVVIDNYNVLNYNKLIYKL